MGPISDGCRLCLDLYAECFTTIENPQLKGQMETVFRFSIEPKQGYSSGVCQSCSYAIAEFYQYSEKVRQNQESLNGNLTAFDPSVESKITFKSIKVEKSSDSELPETTKDVRQLKNRVLGEEATNNGHDGLYKSLPKKSPEITEDFYEPEDEVSEEENPTLESEITIENVKVETFSDSELSETTRKTCELKDQVSGDEGVTNSGSDETLKYLPTGRPGRRKNDDVEADDQLFNKHYSMNCDLCGTSTENFTELRRHIQKKHKRRGYLVCCNKKLFKRVVIRDHIKFHTNPDMFRCELCGYKCKSKDILTSHMVNKHSSEDQGSIKCNYCPQSFVQKVALAKHMKTHVNVRIDTITDPVLPKMTEASCKPKDKVSEEKVPNSCNNNEHKNPPKSKKTKSPVKRKFDDLEEESDPELPKTTEASGKPNDKVSEEEVSNSCNDNERKNPPKNQKIKSPAKRKFDELEEDDQLFNKHFRMICDLCGTSAATFTALQRHFRKEHNRRAYLVCCKKKLFKRNLIRDHIEFHNDPDAFRCNICGTKYKTKHILNIHIFSKHSSDDRGPFKCDQCPQSFAHKSALTLHLKWHVKVKCPKCGKMYACTSSLNTHITRRHGDKERTAMAQSGRRRNLKTKYTQNNRHVKAT